jgi:hypothetical protein
MEEEEIIQQETDFAKEQKKSDAERAAETQSQLELAQQAVDDDASKTSTQYSQVVSPSQDKSDESTAIANPLTVAPPVQKINFVKFVNTLYEHGSKDVFNPYNIANEFIKLNEGPQKYELEMPDDEALTELGFDENQIQLLKTSYQEISQASLDTKTLEYFEKQQLLNAVPDTPFNRAFGYKNFIDYDRLKELQIKDKSPFFFRGTNGVKKWFTTSEIANGNTHLEIDGEMVNVNTFDPAYSTVKDLITDNKTIGADGESMARFTIATDADGTPKLDDRGWFYARQMESDERANSAAYGVESIWGPKTMYNTGLVSETLRFFPDFLIQATIAAGDFVNYGNWIDGGVESLLPELMANLASINPIVPSANFGTSPHALYDPANNDSKTYFQYLMSNVQPRNPHLDKYIDTKYKQWLQGSLYPGSEERDAGIFESPMNTYLAILDGLAQIATTKGIGLGVKGTVGVLGMVTRASKTAPLVTQVNRLNLIERISNTSGRAASYSYNISNVLRSADESAIRHGLTKAESIAMQTIAAMALVITERLTGEQFMPKMAKTGQIKQINEYFQKHTGNIAKILENPAAKANFIKQTVTFMQKLAVKADNILKKSPVGGWPKRFIVGGRREATQEGSEEAINIGGENFYDSILTPEDITAYNNESSANWERIGGGAFVGFITGGIGGVAFGQKDNVEKDQIYSIIRNVVQNKGDISLLKASLKKLYDQGLLDFNDVDDDGNPVLDKSKSKAKSTYDGWNQQIDLIQRAYKMVIEHDQELKNMTPGTATNNVEEQIVGLISKAIASLSIEGAPERVEGLANKYATFTQDILVREAVMTEKSIIDVNKEVQQDVTKAADDSNNKLTENDVYKLADLKKELAELTSELIEKKELLNIDIKGFTQSSLDKEYQRMIKELDDEYLEKGNELKAEIDILEKSHPALPALSGKVGVLYNLQDFRDEIYNGLRADYYVKRSVFDGALKHIGVHLDFQRYLTFESKLNSNVLQQSFLHEFALADNKKQAEKLQKVLDTLKPGETFNRDHIQAFNGAFVFGLTDEQRETFLNYAKQASAMLLDDKLDAEGTKKWEYSRQYAELLGNSKKELDLEVSPQIFILEKEITELNNELKQFEKSYNDSPGSFNKGSAVDILKARFHELFMNLKMYNIFNEGSIQSFTDEYQEGFYARAEFLSDRSLGDNIDTVQLAKLWDDNKRREGILTNIVTELQKIVETDLGDKQLPEFANDLEFVTMSEYKRALTTYEDQVSSAIRSLKKPELEKLYEALDYHNITSKIYASQTPGNKSLELFYFMDLVRGGAFDFNEKYMELESKFDVAHNISPSVIQKEYIRWLYSFLFNSDGNSTEKWTKDFQLSKYIPGTGKMHKRGKGNPTSIHLARNVALFEGFGGVGKTSMVLKTLMELIALYKPNAKYIYTAPQDDQLNTFEQESVKKIGSTFKEDSKIDKKNVHAEKMSFIGVLALLESVADGSSKIDKDFIIIDEATLMKQNRTTDKNGDIYKLLRFVDIINSRPDTESSLKVILSGDTGQLYGAKEFGSVLFVERKKALDDVYRSGKTKAKDIQEAIREIQPTSPVIAGLPPTEFKTDGVNITEGYRWAKDDNDTYISFVSHLNSLTNPTIEKIAMITTNGVNQTIQDIEQVVKDTLDLELPNDWEKHVVDARSMHGKPVDHVYGVVSVVTGSQNDHDPYYDQWHKALLVIISREKESVVIKVPRKPSVAISTHLTKGKLPKYEVNNYNDIPNTPENADLRESKRKNMEDINYEKINFNRNQAGEDTPVEQPTYVQEAKETEEGNHSNLDPEITENFEKNQENDSVVTLETFSSMTTQETSTNLIENNYKVEIRENNPQEGELYVSKPVKGAVNYEEINTWFVPDKENVPSTRYTPVLVIEPARVLLTDTSIEEKRTKALNAVFVEDHSPSKIQNLFIRFNAGKPIVTRKGNTFNITINNETHNVSNYQGVVDLITNINPEATKEEAYGKLEDEKNTGLVFNLKSAEEIRAEINEKYDKETPTAENQRWKLIQPGVWSNNEARARELNKQKEKVTDPENTIEEIVENVQIGSDVNSSTISNEDDNTQIVTELRTIAELNEAINTEKLNDSTKKNRVTVAVEARPNEDPTKDNTVRAFLFKRGNDGKNYRIVVTGKATDKTATKKINDFLLNPETGGVEVGSTNAIPDDNLANLINTDNVVEVFDEQTDDTINEVLEIIRERRQDRNIRLGKKGLFQAYSDIAPNKAKYIEMLRKLKQIGGTMSMFSPENSSLGDIEASKFATAFGNDIVKPEFVLERYIGNITDTWSDTVYKDPIILWFKGKNFEPFMLGALSDNGKLGKLNTIDEFNLLIEWFNINPGKKISTKVVPIQYFNNPFDTTVDLPNNVKDLEGAKEHWGEDFSTSDVHLSTQEVDKEGHFGRWDFKKDKIGDYTYSGRGFILISSTLDKAELNSRAETANNEKSLENLITLSQTEGEFNVLLVSNLAIGIDNFYENVTYTRYGGRNPKTGKVPSDTIIGEQLQDLLKFLGWEYDGTNKVKSRPILDPQFSNEHQAPYILSHIVAMAPIVAEYVNTLEEPMKAKAINILQQFLTHSTSPSRFFLKSHVDKGNLKVDPEPTDIPLRKAANSGNAHQIFVSAIDSQNVKGDAKSGFTSLSPTLISVTTLATHPDGLKFIDLARLKIAAEKEGSGINIGAIERVLNSYHEGTLELTADVSPLSVGNPDTDDARRSLIISKIDSKGNDYETQEFKELKGFAPKNFNWESYLYNSGFLFEGLPFMVFMGLLYKASKHTKFKTKVKNSWKSNIHLNGVAKQWTLNLKRADPAKSGITLATVPKGMDNMLAVSNDARVPNPVFRLGPFLDFATSDKINNPIIKKAEAKAAEEAAVKGEDTSEQLVPEGHYLSHVDGRTLEVYYSPDGTSVKVQNEEAEEDDFAEMSTEKLPAFIKKHGYKIIDSTKGTDSKIFFKKWAGVYKPILHEEAALIWDNIFAVNQWKDKINFKEHLLDTGNLGVMMGHMMYLHSANGHVDSNTVKHEPVHYILNYFLHPTEFRKVLDIAKATLNGRAWLRNKYQFNKDEDISDRTAQEYLANSYEGFDKTLEWNSLPNFIQNIFRWLRNAWYRFSHGSKVTDFFSQIEGGRFRDQTMEYDNDIVDGEAQIFTKEDPLRGKAISELAKLKWKWGNSFNLKSHIEELRKATQREITNFDPEAENHKSLGNAWTWATKQMIRAGGILRRDHKSITDNQFRDYSTWDQSRASDTLSGLYGQEEKARYKGFLTYKYKKNLRKAAFPEMEISQDMTLNRAMEIMTYQNTGIPMLNEGQSTTSKIITSFETSKVNAFRMMSRDVKGMIASARLLTLDENNELVNDGDAFVDESFAKALFIEAFQQLRESGREMNLNSVKTSFKNIIQDAFRGAKKDNAMSIYLKFFADFNERVGGYRVTNGVFKYAKNSIGATTEDTDIEEEYSLKSILDYVAMNKEESPALAEFGWQYYKLYEEKIAAIFSAYASVQPKNFWIAKIDDDQTIDDQLNTIGYNATKEFTRRFEGQINQALFQFDEEQTSTYLNQSWIDAVDEVGKIYAIRKGAAVLPIVELADGFIISPEYLEVSKKDGKGKLVNIYEGSRITADNTKALDAMVSVFNVSGLDNVTVESLQSAFALNPKGEYQNKIIAGELMTLFFRLMVTDKINSTGDLSDSLEIYSNTKGSTGKYVRLHRVFAKDTDAYGSPTNISDYFRDKDFYSTTGNNVVTPTTDIHNMENIALRYFGDLKSPFIDLSFHNEKGELTHTMTLGNDLTNYIYRFNNYNSWANKNGAKSSSLVNDIYENPLLNSGKVGVVGEFDHVKGYRGRATAADSFVEGDHLFARFKYLFLDQVMAAARKKTEENFFMATTKRADKPHLYAIQIYKLYNLNNKKEGIESMHRSAINTAIESAQRYKQNFPKWKLQVPDNFEQKEGKRQISLKDLTELIRSDFKIIEKKIKGLSEKQIRLSSLDKKLDIQNGGLNNVLLADVLGGKVALRNHYENKFRNFIRMVNQTVTLKGKNWNFAVTKDVRAHYAVETKDGKKTQSTFYSGDLTKAFDEKLVHPALTEFFYSTAFNQYFFDEAGTGTPYQTDGIGFDLDLDNGKFDKEQYEISKERMFEEYVKRGSSQTTPQSVMLPGTRTGVPVIMNAITVEDAPWLDMKEATDGLQFATGLMMNMLHSSYGGNSGIGINPFAKPKTSGFMRNMVGSKAQMIRHFDKNGLLFITGELAKKHPNMRNMAMISMLGKDPEVGQVLVNKFLELEKEDDGVDPFDKLHKWVSYELDPDTGEALKTNMTHLITMGSSRKMGESSTHKWDELVPGEILNNHSYDAQDLGIVLELTHESESDTFAAMLSQILYIAGVNGGNSKLAMPIYKLVAELQNHKRDLLGNSHDNLGVDFIMKKWEQIQNNLGNFSLPAEFSRDKTFTPSMPIIDSAVQGVTASLVNRTLSHKIPGDKLILATATGLMKVWEHKGVIYQNGDKIPKGALLRDLKYLKKGKKKGPSSFAEIISKNPFGKEFGLAKESIRDIFGWNSLGINLEASNYDELHSAKWAGKVRSMLNMPYKNLAQLPLARELINQDLEASELQDQIYKAEELIISKSDNKEAMMALRQDIIDLEERRRKLAYTDLDVLYNPNAIATDQDNELYAEAINLVNMQIGKEKLAVRSLLDTEEVSDDKKKEEIKRMTAESFINLDKWRGAVAFYTKGMQQQLPFRGIQETVEDYLEVSTLLTEAKTKHKVMGVISKRITDNERKIKALFSFHVDGVQDDNILRDELARRTVEFNKTLYGFAGRIPSTAMNSAVPVRIVDFVHDSRNVAFVSAERHRISGSDNDGDGDTFWGYKPLVLNDVDSEYAMANTMLVHIIGIWRDFSNHKAVTTPLKVDDYLRKRTDKLERRLGRLSWSDPASDIVITTENDVGEKLTGVGANSFKKYAYYSQSKVNRLLRHDNFNQKRINNLIKSKDENARIKLYNAINAIVGFTKPINLGNITFKSSIGYPNSDMSELFGWDRLGTKRVSETYETIVNGAVDNASNPRFGKMNVNLQTIPYIEVLTSRGLDEDYTYDIFEHPFVQEFFRRYKESNNIRSPYYSNMDGYFTNKFLRGVFLESNPDISKTLFMSLNESFSEKEYYLERKERFNEWKKDKSGKAVTARVDYKKRLNAKFKDTDFLAILDLAQEQITANELDLDAVNYFIMIFQDMGKDIASTWNLNHILSSFKEIKTMPFDNWKQKKNLYDAISIDNPTIKMDKTTFQASPEEQLDAVIKYFDWFHARFLKKGAKHVEDKELINQFVIDTNPTSETIAIVTSARSKTTRANSRLNPWLMLEEMPHIAGALKAARLDGRIKSDNHLLHYPQIRDKFYGKLNSILKPNAISSKVEYNQFMNRWNQFVAGKFIEDSTITRGKKKHNRLLINDIKYDISNPWQRALFVNEFVNYISSIKTRSRDKQFLNALQIKDKVVFIDRNILMHDDDKAVLLAEFDRLDDNLKTNLFYYSLITKGIRLGNQSLSEFISPTKFYAYNNYIKKLETAVETENFDDTTDWLSPENMNSTLNLFYEKFSYVNQRVDVLKSLNYIIDKSGIETDIEPEQLVIWEKEYKEGEKVSNESDLANIELEDLTQNEEEGKQIELEIDEDNIHIYVLKVPHEDEGSHNRLYFGNWTKLLQDGRVTKALVLKKVQGISPNYYNPMSDAVKPGILGGKDINRIRRPKIDQIKQIDETGEFKLTERQSTELYGDGNLVQLMYNYIGEIDVRDDGVYVHKISGDSNRNMKAQKRSYLSSDVSFHLLNEHINRAKINYEDINISWSTEEDLTAWVEDGEVFFNPNKVNLDSPYHEFGHLFLGTVKQVNYADYLNIISSSVDSSIYSEIKDKYQTLRTDEDVMEEAFLTLHGMRLAGVEISEYMPKKQSQNIFQRYSNMFLDYIGNAINKMFGLKAGAAWATNRGNTTTLWDALEYAEESLKANKYGREAYHTVEKLRRASREFYSINTAFDEIGSLEEYISQKREALEEEDFTITKKNTLENAEINKSDGKRYFYDSYKKEERIATKENIDDFVDQMFNARNNIAPIIAGYANSGDPTKLETVFTEHQLENILPMIDEWIADAKHNQYDKIIAYNEESAKELGIWNPFFKNESILLAYKHHKITGNEFQVRLLFPTTTNLEYNGKTRLDEAFGKKTRHLNISLKNSAYDTKKLKIGMFAAFLREATIKNKKELFLNAVELGHYNEKGQEGNEKYKSNEYVFINDILPSLSGISSIGNFIDNIGNKEVKTALENPDNFATEKYNISYLENLSEYLVRKDTYGFDIKNTIKSIDKYTAEVKGGDFLYDSRDVLLSALRERQKAVKASKKIYGRVTTTEDLNILTKDPEWNYLALAVKETYQRWNGIDKRFKNAGIYLNGIDQWRLTGVDMANVEIASALTEFNKTLDYTKNEWKEFVKDLKPIFNNYIRDWKKHTGNLKNPLFENTSNYYKNLWVRKDFNYKDGHGTESKENINTFQFKDPANKSNGLVQYERDFITEINTIINSWVNTYNEDLPSNKKITYRKNMMPFALAPSSRLRNKMVHAWRREDLDIWMKAMWEDHTNYENYDLSQEKSMLRDNPAGFLGQFGRSREDQSHGSPLRYENLGLEYKNGEWVITKGDIDRHKRAEDDVEALMFQVGLTTIKNKRLPKAIQAYESMRTVLMYQDVKKNTPLTLEKAWLDDVFRFLMFNEMRENNLLGKEVDTDKFFKNLKSITSKVILGLAPASAAVDLLASTVVNLTTSWVKLYGEGLFSPADYAWASAISISGITTKKASFGTVEFDTIEKMEWIIEEWNLFNSNANILARDHRRRHTSSSWLNEEHIFFFHHEVERTLTIATFLAQIKHDKILKYFEWKLDSEGERYLSYNVDQEMSDILSGVRKNKVRTKEYLRELIKEREFLATTENQNVHSKAYMEVEITTLRTIKAKLTGAYEDATRGKLDTDPTAMMAATMKKYIIARSNRFYRVSDYESNTVMFYENRQVEYVDDKGVKKKKWMSVPVPIMETSFWGSLIALKQNLQKMEGKYAPWNTPGAYNNLAPHHKAMLKRGIIDTASFALLLASTYAIWGDDRDKNKFSKFLTKIAFDVLGAYNIANYIQAGNGAIPLISLYKAISALNKVLMGDFDTAAYEFKGVIGLGRTISLFQDND